MDVIVKLYDRGNKHAAVNTLEVFNLLVKILVHRGQLLAVSGKELISSTDNIIKQIKAEGLLVRHNVKDGKDTQEGFLDKSSHIKLYPIYPNPFSTSATITYELEEKSPVQFKIYDERGANTVFEFHQLMPADVHTINWAPGHLSAGMYILLIQSGNSSATSRMLFVK